MTLFNFNKTFYKYSTDFWYYSTIMLMIFVYCLLINADIPKNFNSFFNNILFQTFYLILIVFVSQLNKNLGVYLLILYAITFTYSLSNYYKFLKEEETFLGDIDGLNTKEPNLNAKSKKKIDDFIKKLINNVTDVTGIQGGEKIYKKLGLDKS